MTTTTTPPVATPPDDPLPSLLADIAAARAGVGTAAGVLLAGREAMAGRIGRLEAALRESAEDWGEMADYFDNRRLPFAALDCRRRARECREAAR